MWNRPQIDLHAISEVRRQHGGIQHTIVRGREAQVHTYIHTRSLAHPCKRLGQSSSGTVCLRWTCEQRKSVQRLHILCLNSADSRLQNDRVQHISKRIRIAVVHLIRHQHHLRVYQHIHSLHVLCCRCGVFVYEVNAEVVITLCINTHI